MGFPGSAADCVDRRLPEPADFRHGTGAPAGKLSAQRRNDSHRGARAGGLDDSEAAPEALIVRAGQRDRAAQPTLPDDSNAGAITRVNVNEVQSGALASQVALRDGDTIFVPRAETVFVSGQVRSPGAYPIGKTTTVLQALTLAGGVTDRGATNRVRAIRIINGTREQVKIKLYETC